MKYRSMTAWKGAPNGTQVVQYEEGAVYTHSELGDDLAEVALEQGWVVAADSEPIKEEPQLVEVTLEMVKDGMTVPEMKAALKEAGVKTRAKKEEPLAKLILKHELFKGV